jgi:hypothetical protein
MEMAVTSILETSPDNSSKSLRLTGNSPFFRYLLQSLLFERSYNHCRPIS